MQGAWEISTCISCCLTERLPRAMWSSLIGLAYVTESAFAMGPVHLVTGPIAHSYRSTEPCCLYNYVRQGCLQHCNMHSPPFWNFSFQHNPLHFLIPTQEIQGGNGVGEGLYTVVRPAKLLRHQILKKHSLFLKVLTQLWSKVSLCFLELARYVSYLPVSTSLYWPFPTKAWF